MIEEDLAFSLEAANAPLEYGVAKYGQRGGWKAVGMQRYSKAAERHRRERMKYGFENRDSETGLLHIQHEIINLMFQLETYIRKNPGVDVLTYKKPPDVVDAPVTVQLPLSWAGMVAARPLGDKPKMLPVQAEEYGSTEIPMQPPGVARQMQQFQGKPNG